MSSPRRAIAQAVFKVSGLVLMVGAVIGMASGGYSKTGAFLNAALEGSSIPVEPGNWTPPMVPRDLKVLSFSLEADPANAQELSCNAVTAADGVKLVWLANDEEDLSHYMLSIQEDGAEEVTQIRIDKASTEFDDTVEITDGASSVTKLYSLVAVDTEELESPVSDTCQITFDRTSPEVSLSTSASSESFVSGNVEIVAELSDSNLFAYELQLLDAASQEVSDFGGSVEVAADSTAATINHTLETQELEDGNYSLKIIARDTAQNESLAEMSLIVDNTAPESSITAATNYFDHQEENVQNNSFEQGLDTWQTSGEVAAVTTQSGFSTDVVPQLGSSMALLQNTSEETGSVSVISQDFIGSDAISSLGFWYYFDVNEAAPDSTSSMMVFVGDDLVYEFWASELQTDVSGWQYLLLDVSAVEVPSVSISYFSTQPNQSQLFVDQVMTNPPSLTFDTELTVVAQDADEQIVSYAEYQVSGDRRQVEGASPLSFQLEAYPDGGLIEYWSADRAGNVEAKKSLIVVQPNQETVAVEEPATPDVTPDSEVVTPVLSLLQVENNSIQLSFSNMKSNDAIEYNLVYSHAADEVSESVQEAVLNSLVIDPSATDAQQTVYLGTCSEAEGVVCVPHLFVTELEVVATVTEDTGTVYQLTENYSAEWQSPLPVEGTDSDVE